MKKTVLNFIIIALISTLVVSFNSCKKIRHGCVEFKRDYVDPALDDYFFAAFANDVDNLVKENGGQNHDEAATIEVTPTYTTYSYYHADLNLRKTGYTKKSSPAEKEASTTFINKDGKSKPGKGGFFDNPAAFNQTFTAVATGGGGNGGGGGTCSYTTYTGTGCPSGYVAVSSSKCCPSATPYFCSVTNVCYSTCEAAAAAGCANNISFGGSGGGGGGSSNCGCASDENRIYFYSTYVPSNLNRIEFYIYAGQGIGQFASPATTPNRYILQPYTSSSSPSGTSSTSTVFTMCYKKNTSGITAYNFVYIFNDGSTIDNVGSFDTPSTAPVCGYIVDN